MKENTSVTLRVATPDDAAELLSIYAPYIRNTALTFEYDVPTVAAFRERVEKTLAYYPYLVALSAGEIVGYSYAGRYHPRAAYAWDAEMSIYLTPAVHRQGVGSLLYRRMEDVLRAQNIVTTVALITPPMDEYTDFGSVPFHERMGYHLAGRMANLGYKFGRWYDSVIMIKEINSPRTPMSPTVAFDDVRDTFGW